MKPRMPHCRFLLLLLLVCLCGCAAPAVHREPAVERVMPGVLEIEDPARLLSAAHAAYSRFGPSEGVSMSLEAAERVLDVQPDNELANFLAARAALWLLEFGPELPGEAGRELAGTGFGRAQAALAIGGERVEYVFLCGALLGYELKLSRVPGPVRLRRVHDYFQQAVRLDPSYDDGAPLRALGTLLVKAPPWPAGMGDLEQGIDILTEAVRRYPDHPANHLYLAEGLHAGGRDDEARVHLERVLDICREDRWGDVGRHYRQRARQALGETVEAGAAPQSMGQNR